MSNGNLTGFGYSQPAFIENIVATVKQMIEQSGERQLFTYRPDYTRPIDLSNLYRTALHIDEQPAAGEFMHMVQLSNTESDSTWTVLYGKVDVHHPENRDFISMKTWYYQPMTKMMTKEHLVSNLGYRNQADIHQDIATYLLTGMFPPSGLQ